MSRLRAISAFGLMVSCVLSYVLLCTTPTFGQSYPTRYVRIITGSAGTFNDIVARTLGQQLSERWGQPVVVENRPGAGLTIGTAAAAKAAPDGYTLLLADRTALATAPSLYKSLPYDPAKDFLPITIVARAPAMLAMHPSVPANSLQELIDYLRAQPVPVNYASAGHGTSAHLTGALFEQLAKVRLLIVQYKGGANAAISLLRGEAKFSFLNIPNVWPYVSSGKLKALAVTGRERFSGASAIPTSTESGLPGMEDEQWVGILVPAGTPHSIATRLNRDITGIIRTSTFQKVLQERGAIAAPGTAAQFSDFIASETIRLRKLIDISKLAPN